MYFAVTVYVPSAWAAVCLLKDRLVDIRLVMVEALFVLRTEMAKMLIIGNCWAVQILRVLFKKWVPPLVHQYPFTLKIGHRVSAYWTWELSSTSLRTANFHGPPSTVRTTASATLPPVQRDTFVKPPYAATVANASRPSLFSLGKAQRRIAPPLSLLPSLSSRSYLAP